MTAAFILGAVACTTSPIAERGSRADRVFPMANEGDATAQTALGLLYERGLGMPRDPALALVWYRRAAEQGDALAAFHIGSLYERGDGVPRDYAAAAGWYRRASEKGNESAQAALAYLYDRGLGVERDFAAAEELYNQASASWAEVDSYPAEATFATGREGPSLTGPNFDLAPIGERRPEFSAGKEEEPAIEIDLSALDDLPDPAPAATVFDGPEPIAGRGENFPLATGSLTTPEQTHIPDAPETPAASAPVAADSAAVVAAAVAADRAPPQPSAKPAAPVEEARAAEEFEDGLLIQAQPEPERTVLSVRELLKDEKAAGEAPDSPAAETDLALTAPEAPSQKAPEAPSQKAPEAPSEQAREAPSEPEPAVQPEPVQAAQSEPAQAAQSESASAPDPGLASAENELIASLDAELDQEAEAFAAVLDAAGGEEASEPPLAEPLPPEPNLFMISLATYESEALAEAAWATIKATHAGLLHRLPHELEPIDMGEEGQFFELIIGPLDSPVQSRSLCGALRNHGHVCRTIDR